MNDTEQQMKGRERQKDMKRLAGARSICLDAYGMDSVGKRYDRYLKVYNGDDIRV